VPVALSSAARKERGLSLKFSPRIKALSLILFLLTILPVSASGNSLENVELKEFNGLKILFGRLRSRIEERFDNAAVAREILHSRDAYHKLAAQLSTREQKQLQIAYTQGTAYWQQFQRVSAHVLGSSNQLERLGYSQMYDIFVGGGSVTLPTSAGAQSRDRFVGRMDMLGYTPKEITDVISGRISLSALKNSDRMRTLGYKNEVIAAYLEERTRDQPSVLHSDSHQIASSTAVTRLLQGRQSEREQLDNHVTHYARHYGINPNLIRAVITNESSWRVKTRSPAGAVGLMQLMPGTAKMLGVDPLDPEQNIEGGIRYLSALIEMFDGDLDAALVGYNAGPSHAKKWRKGHAVLYGETSDYLKRVKLSYAKLEL
jgi:hypothetical protein